MRSLAQQFTVPATDEIAISWTDAGGAPLRGNWTQVKYAGGGGSYSAHVDRIVGLPAGPATVILRVPGYREWRSTATVAFDRVANVEARFEAVGSGR